MNSNIIKKCIDELNKDNFRKDYVLGMLESLYETQDKVFSTSVVTGTPPLYAPPFVGIPNSNTSALQRAAEMIKEKEVPMDEVEILNAQTAAMMKKVDLTAIQTE